MTGINEKIKPDKTDGKSGELDPIMNDVKDNLEIFQSGMRVLKRLEESGIIDLLDNMSKDYMPTDVEFLAKFFTSREFSVSMIKSGNLLVGLLYSLMNEETSDLIKLLLFNSGAMTDAVIAGAKEPKKMSVFSLMSMLKDPDVASGMTAVFGILKVFGSLVRDRT